MARVRFNDLTGQRFGRLVVLKEAEKIARKTAWFCLCDCGTEIIVRAHGLLSKNSTSCGCYRIEKLKEKCITHGQSHNSLYDVYSQIIQRCTNPKYKQWEYYGGRGITVCDRWRYSFENFFADMGERPFEGAEVDRENNDLGYSPDNCRWVTKKVNMNNRRNSKKNKLTK
jgi:hypothetical protein